MEQGAHGTNCFVLLAGICDVRIKPQHDLVGDFVEEHDSDPAEEVNSPFGPQEVSDSGEVISYLWNFPYNSPFMPHDQQHFGR